MSTSLLSPKMASKRLPDTDTIYPPKKRALYEHRKFHGVEKYTANQITASDILEYPGNGYSMGFPVAIEMKHSGNFLRPRSDSLQSQVSSNSDQTESGSTESRETSPCTIKALFDHRTPERNPITSLDGLKPDISKPLFPPSDSDNSTAGSDGHLSPGNSMYGEPEETESESSVNVKNSAYVQEASNQRKTERKENRNLKFTDRWIFYENIPENAKSSFHEKNVSNMSFQQKHIPAERELLKAKENMNCDSITQKGIYMGPMVSLLQRFNAEALQRSEGLIADGEKENSAGQNSSQSLNTAFSCLPKQSESFGILNSIENTFHSSDKLNGLQTEKIFCRICHKEFLSRAHLHTHMKMHENKNIPCWVCKEVFVTTDSLNMHMKMSHGGANPYKCEHCSREFSQYNNLRRHMRVHREKVFKCNLCNREFNEEFYLKMHMGTHTGKRVYSCGVCGEGFQSNHDLKMHVKTHSPSLLHTCNVCGKSFSKACVLRQHKKGHSGERPHKCDKCEKTFIHRHHLTMHSKSHMDEKKLSCDICEKEFTQHSHLYKHLRAHEEGKDLSKGKLNQNTKSVQNQKSEDREMTEADKINASQIPKVVLSSDEHSSNNFVEKNQTLVEVVKESGKEGRQRRGSVSQHSIPANTHNVNPVTENTKSVPSFTETFRHQIERYPSMPFLHGMPQSYHAGSRTHPVSPYHPLLTNGVPVSLPGYQSYSQLYRNYSEQMQNYYNNMYMMNFLSQNAFLQTARGKSQSCPNMPKTENSVQIQEIDRSYRQNSPMTFNTVQQKFVQDNEKEDKTQNIKEYENLKNVSVVESEILEETENIDVVNEIDEQNLESVKKKHYFLQQRENESGTKIELTERQNHAEMKDKTSFNFDTCTKAEEHEIAQELLKMSAGTEINIPKRELTHADTVKQKKTQSQAGGMHYIKDIIEGTVRSSERKTEVTRKLKKENTNIQNSFSIQARGSKLDEPETNDVPEESEETRNSECGSEIKTKLLPSNPLQKLELFVTSDGKFNQTGKLNQDVTLGPTDYQEVEDVSVWTEIRTAENGFKNPDSEYSERQGRHVDGNGVESQKDGGALTESLGLRLERIRKFANIGLLYGDIGQKCGDTGQKCEKIKKEETTEDGKVKSNGSVYGKQGKACFYNAAKTIDTSSQVQAAEVKSENEKGDNQSENAKGRADKNVEIARYFDDSFEDRQLEIDERNGSERDGNAEELNGVQNSEDTSAELNWSAENMLDNTENSNEENNSAGLNEKVEKEFVLTENEFVSHMASMINVGLEKRIDNQVLGREGSDVYEVYSYHGDKNHCMNQQKADASFCNVRKDKLNNLQKSENGHTVKVDIQESEKCNFNVKERSSDEKRSEIEAVDLRIVARQPAVVRTEAESNENKENENIPIDLSFGRKSKEKLNGGHEKREHLSSENRNFTLSEPPNYDNLFFCQFCDKTFDQLEILTEHVNFHRTLEKPYICTTCHRGFTQRHNLNRHKMSHSSKSYECTVCNRSFKESFYLQMHMKTHNDENCHKCQICGENIHKEEIWQHTNQHLGNMAENPTYRQIGHRVQEILHEQNVKMYGDSERSKNGKYSNSHRKTVGVISTGEEFRSVQSGALHNETGQEREEALNLKKEKNENWNGRKVTQVSGIGFDKVVQQSPYDNKLLPVLKERKMENLDRNSNSCPSYECTMCNIVLDNSHKLTNHMSFHNGTRPFVCNTCGRAFKKKKGLRTHEKLHVNSAM